MLSINSVFEYTEIRFNKNKKKLTLSQETEIHDISSGNGLKFAFRWVTARGLAVNRSLGEITMKQASFDDCSNTVNCFTETDIPLEECNVYEFSNGITPEESKNVTFLCPKQDINLKLQSNGFGKNSKLVAVYIKI